ncbi:hypothetical protein FXO38_00849 [Capsicum annuum]|nr:hypothetical protein FXO38_00849 [Capsicum annuum]
MFIQKKELFAAVSGKIWGEENDEDAFKFANLYFIHGFLMSSVDTVNIPRLHFDLVESDRYRDYPWGLLAYEELAKSLNKRLKPKGKFYMLYGMPLTIQIWLYECCSAVPRTIASKTNVICPRYESLMKSLFNDANDKVVFKNIEPTRKEISTFQIPKIFHGESTTSTEAFNQQKKYQGDSSYSPAKKKLKNQSKGADQHTPKRNTPSHAVNISSVKTPTFKLVQSEETVPSNRKDIPVQSSDVSFFKHSDEDDLVSKKVFEKFRDEDQMEDGHKNTSPHHSTPTNVEGFHKNPEGIWTKLVVVCMKQEMSNAEAAAGIIENTSTTDVQQLKLDEKVNSEVHIHEAASEEGKGELDLRDSQATLPDELLPSLNAYVNLERSIIVHPSANKEQMPMNVSRVGRQSKFKESPFTTKFGSAEGSTEVQTKKFNLKHPFASHPIHDIEDTKVTNKFLAWLSVDLLKYHAKKSNREEHYKKNKSRMSVMNFDILSVDDKNWFYIIGTPEKSWSDEQIDVCLYYLRKKSKYEPNSSYSYSTVDCNFMNIVSNVLAVYSIDDPTLDAGGKEYHLNEYISGFRMHANRSIYVYDSMSSAGHDSAVLAEVQKLAECITIGGGVPKVDFDPDLPRTRYAAMLWHYGKRKEEEKAQSDDEAPSRPRRKIQITEITEVTDIFLLF